MSAVLVPLQTTYLAHLNMNQSCTSLEWLVWSVVHQFWPLKWDNFFPESVTLLSSRKRASANCLHLLERDSSFAAIIALFFLHVPGDTLPLSVSSVSHGLRLIHRRSGNYFPDSSITMDCWVYKKMPFQFTLDKKSCLIHKLIIWECHNNKLWLLNLFQKWCQD